MADNLEQRLTALGEKIEWPPTPELRFSAVERPISKPRFQLGVPRWALAAVAVLVILATLLAYTPTRTAIAGWLNLHTNISRTTTLPTPSPLPSGALGSNLGLGTPTTLQAAQRSVGWHIVVPAQLGAPDAVYLLMPPDGPSQGEVTLVYAPRPDIPAASETGVGVLVTEAQGTVNEQFFGKTLAEGTTITPVTVDGHQGWWIAGQPHAFVFLAYDGSVRFETLRLATNTLVIDDGGTIVRIEANVSESQAMQIAGTLA